MVEKNKHLIQLLGTLSLIHEKFASLSFLAKVDFFGKWLNPNVVVLNEVQSQAISNEQAQINQLLRSWQKVVKRVDLSSEVRRLQEFRLKLDKIVSSQLKYRENADKLASASAVKLVISRAGCYQGGKPLTTPDPQLTKEINQFIDNLQNQRLSPYKKRFTRLKLSAQAKVIQILNSTVSSVTVGNSWVHRLKAQLAKMNSEHYKANFIDDLFKAHQQKFEERHIERPRKELFIRFGLQPTQMRELSRKAPARELFGAPRSHI